MTVVRMAARTCGAAPARTWQRLMRSKRTSTGRPMRPAVGSYPFSVAGTRTPRSSSVTTIYGRPPFPRPACRNAGFTPPMHPVIPRPSRRFHGRRTDFVPFCAGNHPRTRVADLCAGRYTCGRLGARSRIDHGAALVPMRRMSAGLVKHVTSVATTQGVLVVNCRARPSRRAAAPAARPPPFGWIRHGRQGPVPCVPRQSARPGRCQCVRPSLRA
jgi:hypothetical protein